MIMVMQQERLNMKETFSEYLVLFIHFFFLVILFIEKQFSDQFHFCNRNLSHVNVMKGLNLYLKDNDMYCMQVIFI